MPCEWHERLQSSFRPHVEMRFEAADTAASKNRRADAVCEGRHVVYELQHSPMSSAEVRAREHDYALHGMTVTWIVDGNGPGIDVRYLETSRTYMIVFRDAWKYATFAQAGCASVYLEREGQVFRFAPREVRCSMIDVRRPVAWDPEFVSAAKEGRLTTIWDDTPLPQSTLYHSQRGAGNGKTYDSIQLIASADAGCLGRKTTFLYFTKVHTAKSVICDELRDQNAGGKLDAAIVPGTLVEHHSGKQIKFEFERTSDGARVRVIVGTIDSFMYAMGDKGASMKSGGDLFAALRHSIRDGHRAHDSRTGGVRYAQSGVNLNKECMLVVDEAQDLPPSYIEAVAAIQRDTHIDVFVIGDKMQSIWGKDNVFTFLEREGLPHTDTHVIGGPNKVRRFHRRRFAEVVNRITPFHLYESPGHALPSVSSVCDGCDKYAWAHAFDDEEKDEDVPALVLFDQPDTRNDVALAAEKLTAMVSAEVERRAFLPEHFMFIFAFVAKSCLAVALETSLTNFWMAKFADPAYRRRARLAEHPYWKDRLDDDAFYNYAYLHKSEENRPIDLSESVHSTRLLSIHASKGQGCEIVYLLDVSEDALKLYSKGEIDLVYESLLHVAVTRQKVGLRVGLPCKHDDIRRRFTGMGSDTDGFEAGGRIAGDKTNVSDVVALACSDRQWCERMNEAYFLPLRLHDLLPKASSPSSAGPEANIVEWGHYVVRFTALRYAVLCEIERSTGDTRQVDAIIIDIIRARPRAFRQREYYRALHKINDENAKGSELAKVLPILAYDDAPKTAMYARHCETFVRYVTAVQKKLSDARRHGKALPSLCPVETCVFSYAQEVLRQGVYSSIKAADVYKILDSVSKAGVRHAATDCICLSVYDGERKEDAARLSSATADVDHFDVLVHVRPMFASFLSHVVDRLGEDEADLRYNVDHVVRTVGGSAEFTLWDTLPFVVNGKRAVVVFVLRPTFGALSCHVDFMDALFKIFVTAHPPDEANNAERFGGKRVLVCFFTFTCPSPVWIDLGEAADLDVLRGCLADAMARTHRASNSVLLAGMKGACEKTDDPRVAFQLVEEYVAKRLGQKKSPPKYMTEFLACVKRDVRRTEGIAEKIRSGYYAEELEDAMRLSIDDWLSAYRKKEE